MRADLLKAATRALAFICGAAIAIILAYAIGLLRHAPIDNGIPDARAGPRAIALKMSPSDLRAAIERAHGDPNPADTERFIIDALFAAVIGDPQREEEMRICVGRAETKRDAREGIRSLAACVDLIARR